MGEAGEMGSSSRWTLAGLAEANCRVEESRVAGNRRSALRARASVLQPQGTDLHQQFHTLRPGPESPDERKTLSNTLISAWRDPLKGYPDT